MMKMDYTALIFFGGVVSILGVGVATWATYKSGIETGKQTEEIITTGSSTNNLVNQLKEENNTLKNQVDSIRATSDIQLQQISNLTTQNADLAVQLGNSTMLLSQSITGGNGFCELDFVTGSNFNVGKVVVKNHGKFPLHDFKARICDLEKLDLWAANNPGTLYPDSNVPLLPPRTKFPHFEIDLGTVLPGDLKELPVIIELGKYGSKSSFNIFIEGKNGRFCQLLRYYKITDKWVKATRILDLKNSMQTIILYEHIDNDFPINELKW